MDIDKTERIFREHYRGMYRMAYTMLRDAEQSKDIVSEVFAKVCDGRIVIRQDMSESAFLLTCVRNQCLNLISSLKRDEKLRQLYALDATPVLSLNEDEAERWQQINAFMESELTPQTQAVMRLCFLQRLTYKGAAEELGISVAAVNKHIVQGLQKLRKHFKK